MAYLNIPEIYWDDETLNNDERVMLSIVHSYQGSCFWSISKWCEKFRHSKPTILGLIRTLEERGYLEAIRVNGKSTTYRILDQTGKKSLPVKKLDRTGKETLLVPVKNFDHTGKESLPYIYKYNNNHKESYNNSIVADAPLPNETELKDSLTDLKPVKEPLDTLAEPEPSDVTHPPRDSAPPLPKKKKAPSRKTSFPSPEYWEAATPKLIEWAIDNGADDSSVARWVQEKIMDMGDSAAANGYQFIDWVAAFRKWYRRDLPKGSGPEADIRKATVWLWNHTHGERMEKPPASPIVVTAVRKTLEQLGKSYLTALGETEEKWRELKLKELRQMIHDNLEAAQ